MLLTAIEKYANISYINVNLYHKLCPIDLSTVESFQLCKAGLIYLCCMTLETVDCNLRKTGLLTVKSGH